MITRAKQPHAKQGIAKATFIMLLLLSACGPTEPAKPQLAEYKAPPPVPPAASAPAALTPPDQPSAVQPLLSDMIPPDEEPFVESFNDEEKAKQAASRLPPETKIIVIEKPAKPAFDTSEMMALAKTNKCTNCHQLDSGRMGPSFREIARRYKNQPDAEAELIESISMGSSGKWSVVMMPANAPRVSRDHIQQLTQFILSL